MEQGLGDIGRIGHRCGQHVDEGQLDAAHHEIHERLLDGAAQDREPIEQDVKDQGGAKRT